MGQFEYDIIDSSDKVNLDEYPSYITTKTTKPIRIENSDDDYIVSSKSFELIQKKLSDYRKKLEILGKVKKQKKVNSIYGEIVEIRKDFIILRCLTDLKQKIFELRKFEISPFKGMDGIEVGGIIKISIFIETGSKCFQFSVVDYDIAIQELFEEPVDYFKDPEYESFFRRSDQK